MAAVANSPSFAKKVGVPQSVGKDFNEADKGRKFSKGGDTMASKMKKGGMHKMPDGKMMKDSAMKKMNMGGMGGMDDMGYKKGGAVRGEGIAKRGFADGGKVQTVQVKGMGAARARTAKIC
jgi:hypothetical protein